MEKRAFSVYNITCNENFLFPFFFLPFAFIGVVKTRVSTNQNVKSIELIFQNLHELLVSLRKRAAERLCVTNVTRLSLVCHVVIFT